MARTKKQAGPTCVWTLQCEDEYWLVPQAYPLFEFAYETACGEAFVLNDGTPTENKMSFCCYCGRRLKVER